MAWDFISQRIIGTVFAGLTKLQNKITIDLVFSSSEVLMLVSNKLLSVSAIN